MRPRRGGQHWTLSILLHLGIAGLVVGGWYWAAHRPQPAQDMGIEARVVPSAELNEVVVPPPPEPVESEPMAEPAPLPEPEPEPEPDPGPTAEELAAQAQAEEAARAAEEQRIAAEREQAERRLAAEKAERERQEKARREQVERERVAREKAAKEKAEREERERLAREKAEQEAAEKARLQREEELAASVAAEERLAAARASGLQNQYVAQIAAKVERAWIRPPGATVGLDCEVRVTQVPGGTVTGVTIGRCNGDEAVRRSIEDAVSRASPLPAPPDPALFDRNIRFNFKPAK